MKMRSKASLYLMELVLAILVFARAKVISCQNKERNLSVLAAQSAAECYKAVNGDLKKTADILSGEMTPEDSIVVYYDKDFKKTSENEGMFFLSLREKNDHGIIEVTKNGEEKTIFSIEVKAVNHGD